MRPDCRSEVWYAFYANLRSKLVGSALHKIPAVIEAARSKNESRSITGILLFDGENFLQPEACVVRVICTDRSVRVV